MLILLMACLRTPVEAPEIEPARIDFAAVTAPVGAERRAVRSGAPGFQILARVGDTLGEAVFGQLLDIEGRPIPGVEGSRICNSSDFTGLIAAAGGLFMVSQFECQPGAIYLTALDQDPESGALSARWTRPVDFSGVRGGNLHCAGDVTPWNTLLSSEEYEGDARKVQPDGTLPDNHHNYNALAGYFGGSLEGTKVYDYGWMPEVTVLSADGDAAVVKRYALGRFSHELGIVMPDRRTVYLSDDGYNGGFFLFVADRAEDLSSGQLYAARWTGTADTARLDWIPLGHGDEATIAGWLTDDALTFDDLFETAEPGEGGCPEGFTSVNTSWGRECLRLREGMAAAASRLETRRYAALLGATTEFSKAEGLTFDPDRGQVYLALTVIGSGMLAGDPRWDRGGPDHIRLPGNPCGAVYGFAVVPSALDTAGAPIDSAYVVGPAAPVVAGTPRTYEGDLAGNTCDLDGIANPDNLSYVPGRGLLMIAEDTSFHVNNALWAVDLASGDRTRVMTVPLRAEVTGIHWFSDLGGFSYLTASVYEPFRGLEDATPEERRSQVGYFGPFPAR